jgi:hypothetical protein
MYENKVNIQSGKKKVNFYFTANQHVNNFTKKSGNFY